MTAPNKVMRAAMKELVRLGAINRRFREALESIADGCASPADIARHALALPTPAQTTPAEPSDTASTNPLEHTE